MLSEPLYLKELQLQKQACIGETKLLKVTSPAFDGGKPLVTR